GEAPEEERELRIVALVGHEVELNRKAENPLFLGWTESRYGRHFYVRQLHDMKITLLVELFTLTVMVQYAQYRGWALARVLSRKLFENVNSLFANESDGYKTTSAPSAFRFSCGRSAGIGQESPPEQSACHY